MKRTLQLYEKKKEKMRYETEPGTPKPREMRRGHVASAPPHSFAIAVRGLGYDANGHRLSTYFRRL